MKAFGFVISGQYVCCFSFFVLHLNDDLEKEFNNPYLMITREERERERESKAKVGTDKFISKGF